MTRGKYANIFISLIRETERDEQNEMEYAEIYSEFCVEIIKENMVLSFPPFPSQLYIAVDRKQFACHWLVKQLIKNFANATELSTTTTTTTIV